MPLSTTMLGAVIEGELPGVSAQRQARYNQRKKNRKRKQASECLSKRLALFLSILVSPACVRVEAQSSSPVPSPTVSVPAPSVEPTRRAVPTLAPTGGPTTTPYPTDLPSLSLESFDRKRFQQPFEVRANSTETAFLAEGETSDMGQLFTGYTPRFAPEGTNLQQVTSLCTVASQSISQVENTTTFINAVDYTCQYSSMYQNVTGFPDLFLAYVNGNLTGVTEDLVDLGLPILATEEAKAVSVITAAPTISLRPSAAPTVIPTRSPRPTLRPTMPSVSPTQDFSLPTTPPPSSGSTKGLSVPAISSIVVLSAVAVLIAIVYFSRRRRQQYLTEMQSKRTEAVTDGEMTSASGPGGAGFASGGPGGALALSPPPAYRPYGGGRPSDFDTEAGGNKDDVISPSGSLMSNKSLLSDGGSDLEGQSSDEVDGTNHLKDEFDQYKDQNLEQLRTEVEENLTGFEDIMSAAVTKALIGDDDSKVDPTELLWGCQPDPAPAEVEASALCEVCDWLKRNGSESDERKREFMQDILNKMVASVRNGVLEADDASRTIHESAALLELELANELPMTTVIVSGMRMSIEASVIVTALDEFGDIDTAAVASGERGFAIVRFRNPKAVEKALRQYRDEEIVIEDVAIQMKVLTPSGEVLSR